MEIARGGTAERGEARGEREEGRREAREERRTRNGMFCVLRCCRASGQVETGNPRAERLVGSRTKHQTLGGGPPRKNPIRSELQVYYGTVPYF